MTKCAHCNEPIFFVTTFNGIPKKKFCSRCGERIQTLRMAQKYIFNDPKLWDWTLRIIDE